MGFTAKIEGHYSLKNHFDRFGEKCYNIKKSKMVGKIIESITYETRSGGCKSRFTQQSLRSAFDCDTEHQPFYKKGAPKKQKFSISVPRACYISKAFEKTISDAVAVLK